MSELEDLYQEVILEHSKHPRNFHAMETANRQAEGYNPLCGDHYTVFVDVADNTKASASMMSQVLKSKTTAEAEELFDQFHEVVTGAEGGDAARIGKLAAFAGVANFPTRIKCATLAWHTLHAALEGKQVASTE
jgi:nitrogen fixation NifU-like protein